MRRRRSLRAEIVLGFDETSAEILLPDAVRGDARGERVVGCGQPASEVEAS